MDKKELAKARKFWASKDESHLKKLIGPDRVWIQSNITNHINWIFKDIEWDKDWKIAEIGCGIGRLLSPLGKMFKAVHGVDFSKDMIETAENNIQPSTVITCWVSNKDDLRLNAVNFELEPEGYDFVFSFITFQHIHDKEIMESYLKQAFEALKPGGLIRIQTHKGLDKCEGTFRGHSGAMFEGIAEFAQMFVDVGFEIVKPEEGLGFPEWLWITAEKPIEKQADWELDKDELQDLDLSDPD